MRKTICVDFDGVIHSYNSGWKGSNNIPDDPVPGALMWLFETIQTYEIAIMSARSHQSGGIGAMKAWLKRHASVLGVWKVPKGAKQIGLERVQFPTAKPGALIYIDDRGFRFEGTFPTVDDIERKPWNK